MNLDHGTNPRISLNIRVSVHTVHLVDNPVKIDFDRTGLHDAVLVGSNVCSPSSLCTVHRNVCELWPIIPDMDVQYIDAVQISHK